jgi:hypothetical protein
MGSQWLGSWVPAVLTTLVTLFATTNSKSYKFQIIILRKKNGMRELRNEEFRLSNNELTCAPNSSQMKIPSLILITPMMSPWSGSSL